MTRYEIETACFNYLDGQDVGDVRGTVRDFMENVIDPGFEDLDRYERDSIENVAEEWFTERKHNDDCKAEIRGR